MSFNNNKASNNNKQVSNNTSTNEKTDGSTYTRNLGFLDLFFAGYGFIIGAGIFTLVAYILTYGKGSSWLAFVIGGVICGLTGMGYAKLNAYFPTNDAEYIWIMKILNPPTHQNQIVKYFANIVIWIVMLIGLFTAATIVVGQSNFIREYYKINKVLLIGILILFPTIVNMLGNKYTTGLNKTIMIIVTFGFVLLYGISGRKSKFINEVELIPKKTSLKSLIHSSYITIFAYNGFQSIVQLSEEAKNRNHVPKSILGALTMSTIIYALIAISIIALIGVKKGSASVSPISDAFSVVLGKRGKDFVNIIAIIALTNTFLIATLSRSRLLQKLSVRGIAPKFLGKLTSLKNIFGLEKFNNNSDSDKANSDKAIHKTTLPIASLIVVSIVTFFLTFIKKGAIEALAKITNGFIYFIFTVVNLLVLIYHFKRKTAKEQKNIQNVEKEMPMLKGFPWYSVLGLVFSITYLFLSPTYLGNLK
jgi:amino acid transporter